MNRASTIDQLVAIWEQVLKRSPIEVTENFFEIGGTPELAAQMFCEIAKTFGREIPPVMIYEASTIARLNALLDNSATSNYCPPLFAIKSGSGPAIFLAHGMGADALQLFQLAQDLGVSNAIYATQAQGIDSVTKPLQTVEQMAEVYLGAIRAVQPHGPYLLVGYSLGGLVMLEVARSLVTAGQQVALLAMLDTYPHRMHLRPMQQFPLLLKLIRQRLSGILRGLRNESSALAGSSALDLAYKRIHACEFIAWKSYKPQPYAGKVYFLRATVPTYYPKDARSVWAPYLREFEMRDIPGNHTELISSQHKLVADLLAQEIKQVLDREFVA